MSWAAERGDLVNVAVQDKIDELGVVGSPQPSCIQSSCPPAHRCVQASLERNCVEGVAGADACGCVGSFGWASGQGVCAKGATTSDAEAMPCGAGFPEGVCLCNDILHSGASDPCPVQQHLPYKLLRHKLLGPNLATTSRQSCDVAPAHKTHD